jgi:hypothetical protein
MTEEYYPPSKARFSKWSLPFRFADKMLQEYQL